MFRKKDEKEQEKNLLEDLDFYIAYHIAEWYPDTEIGKKIIQDSVFIKEEAKLRMREAAKIFDDPSFSNLSRSEKITIYRSKI